MWQITNNGLLTNSRMAKWSLSDPYCNRCSFWEETVIHVLRDHPLASNVWQHLIKVNRRGGIFIGDLKNWIEFNMNHNIGQ